MLFPAVLMLFALAMEKVQSKTDEMAVTQDHVEEFLESAGAAQVDTLAKEGFPAALDEFRNLRVVTEASTQDLAAVLDSPKRAS